MKPLVWLRPKQIFGNDNFKLYYTIDIDDIHQGILGNCYFLSSVSALAEFPERFNKIFLKSDISLNGCYSVQFYINGKPKIVTIDDTFPCFAKTKKWAFSYAGNKEIWVQILEKAWAKVCGSYAGTIAGLPSEALSTLCEAPCFSYVHKRYDKNVIWKILLESDKKNYIICTNSTDKQDAEKEGIALSHAYTVISCLEAKGIKFVKLRNPWGQFEWKGDYSDNSPLWTNELKRELGYKKENDGIFFMTFEDFIKFYPYTFACKFEEGFQYDYKKLKPENNTSYAVCKIKIEKSTKITIGLHQKQVRFYKKIKGYKVSNSRLIVAKYDKTNRKYEFIGSDFSNNEKLYVSLDDLQPGEYYIFGQVCWPYKEKNCSFVISTYSSILSKIQPVSFKDIQFDWLNQILTSYLIKYKKPRNVVGEIDAYESLEDNHTGYHFVQFYNKSSKTNLLLTSCSTNEYSKLISKNFGKKEGNNNFIELYLYPKEGKTLIFEIKDIYKSKISFKNYENLVVDDNLKDENKLFLSKYVDYIEKEFIAIGIYFMEVKIMKNIFFIFFNHDSWEANFRIKFEKISNVKLDLDGKSDLECFVNKHSFNYISVTIVNPDKPYECKISYTLT